MNRVQKLLFESQDLKYKAFHQKLMPTINPDLVIGVRVPKIRNLAKSLPETEKEEFLKSLPHKFYEENMLHTQILCMINDYDACIQNVKAFLPFVDNWAVCDSLKPKIFKKHKTQLLKEIKIWLKSKKTYEVRFAVLMLMTHFLAEDFTDEILDLVKNIKSEEYYINMMIAWFFATALCFEWQKVIEILKSKCLSVWVHNKTIQKAVESFRISAQQKEYLKTLKI